MTIKIGQFHPESQTGKTPYFGIRPYEEFKFLMSFDEGGNKFYPKSNLTFSDYGISIEEARQLADWIYKTISEKEL